MVQQYQMQYNPEQDRIMFRLKTSDHEEIRLHLTRRIVSRLYPVLIQVMEENLRQRDPGMSHVAKEILEFEKEEVLSGTNFKEKFVDEDVDAFPLGDAPILVSKIKVKSGPRGHLLCLYPSEGQGIEINVDNRFLHPMCRMLKDISEKAEWNIEFQEGLMKNQSVNMPSSQKKRVLH